MKLTVAQLYDAINALVTINNTPRIVPSMAKYQFARMHDALEPTFNVYNQKRIALIQQHGAEQFSDAEKKVSVGWGADPRTEGGKLYAAAWDEILKEEVDIDVKPISLQVLGNDPKGIEMSEYKQLGELVVDNS